MNKQLLDRFIPLAYQAIKDNGILDEKGKVPSGFRGQIASFGAAVAMGSLLSAVAVFSDDGKSAVNRSQLMDAIYQIIHDGKKCEEKALMFEVLNIQEDETEEIPALTDRILTAAIAIKLALNLYPTAKADAETVTTE